MYIELDIGKYLIWYWILTVVLLCVGLIASYIHWKEVGIKPFLFTGVISLVMILTQTLLSTIVFSVLDYDWNTQFFEWVLLGWFSLIFFGFLGLISFNLIRYGEAWQ